MSATITTPNTNQQVMTLSWLANSAGINNWSQSDLQNAINSITQTYWSDADWDVVWGPVYYTPKDASTIGNTMFVAQQTGQNGTWYVIAIAGTNPSSTFDWIREDAAIAPIPWAYYAQAGQVTTGDNMGLTNLLDLTYPNINNKSQQITLQAFLADLPNKNSTQLTITGHSLGGALSPLLTLALMDPNSSASKVTINSTTIDISLPNWQQATLLATAGPTPGDATFANYVKNFIDDNPSQLTAEFIWNGNDIVPHAWNLATLNELPGIYDFSLPSDSCLSAAISSAINAATSYTYTQFNLTSQFSGKLQPYTNTENELIGWGPNTEYLAQADYQHTEAYLDYFDCGNWLPTNDICNDPVKAEELYVAFSALYKLNGGTGCI